MAALPRLEGRARAAFRRLPNPDDRDAAAAEAVALAWMLYLKGHRASSSPRRLAGVAVHRVRLGRTLGGFKPPARH